MSCNSASDRTTRGTVWSEQHWQGFQQTRPQDTAPFTGIFSADNELACKSGVGTFLSDPEQASPSPSTANQLHHSFDMRDVQAAIPHVDFECAQHPAASELEWFVIDPQLRGYEKEEEE